MNKNGHVYVSLRHVRGPHLKVLKAKYVEDPDGFEVVLPFDLLVDPKNDPGETLGI